LWGIVATILNLSDEDELIKDEFVRPFGTFLLQFLKTDTFDGRTGEFYLGSIKWVVKN
jgi:hypothetical protein